VWAIGDSFRMSLEITEDLMARQRPETQAIIRLLKEQHAQLKKRSKRWSRVIVAASLELVARN
jgi:hypothetical protein